MIDWNKPLQGINGEEFKEAGRDEWFVYGTAGRSAGIWTLESGEPIKPLAHHVAPLRNIPEEPEREEGWYHVKSGPGSHWRRSFYDMKWGWQSDRDGILPNPLTPFVVGDRDYDSDEYRPADKFPPPMDGTQFEVEGCEKTWRFEPETNVFVTTRQEDYECTYVEELLQQNKRWRPVQ